MDDIETRTLRNLLESLERALASRGADHTPGTHSKLGKVYNAGAMPASLPGVFSVHPVSMSGAETEGAAYTATASTASTVFTVIGSTVPAVGDILKGYLIDGKWVAERGGSGSGGGNILVGCPCTIPPIIYFRIANPNPPRFDAFACQLTYDPTSAMVLSDGFTRSGAAGYWSTTYETQYPDPGYYTRWFLGLVCRSGAYYQYVSYSSFYTDPTIPGGPYIPGLSGVGQLLTEWLPGAPGNTCTPFLLSSNSGGHEYNLTGLTVTSVAPPTVPPIIPPVDHSMFT